MAEAESISHDPSCHPTPLAAAHARGISRRLAIFHAGMTDFLRSVDVGMVGWRSSWNGTEIVTDFFYAPDTLEPWRPRQKIYRLIVSVDSAGHATATDPETGDRFGFEVVRKARYPIYLLTDDEFARVTPVMP